MANVICQRRLIEWKINENGCYICVSHKPSTRGYPVIKRQGKRTTVARYLWAKANGPIPKGLCIRHKCDNPMCINLEHLEPGTQKDNSHDMVERARSARGEVHYAAELTEQDVREIRAFGPGITQVMISLLYGISAVHVCHIRQGKRWKHVS